MWYHEGDSRQEMNVRSMLLQCSVHNEKLLKPDHSRVNVIVEYIEANEPSDIVSDLLAEQVEPKAIETAFPKAPNMREGVRTNDENCTGRNQNNTANHVATEEDRE